MSSYGLASQPRRHHGEAFVDELVRRQPGRPASDSRPITVTPKRAAEYVSALAFHTIDAERTPLGRTGR